VRAVRQGSAGQDAGRRAGRDRAVKGAAGGGLADHAECPARVRGTHGEAVDRAGRKRRQGGVCDQVLGQRAPRALGQGETLDAEDGRVLEDERRRLTSVDQGIGRSSHFTSPPCGEVARRSRAGGGGWRSLHLPPCGEVARRSRAGGGGWRSLHLPTLWGGRPAKPGGWGRRPDSFVTQSTVWVLTRG